MHALGQRMKTAAKQECQNMLLSRRLTAKEPEQALRAPAPVVMKFRLANFQGAEVPSARGQPPQAPRGLLKCAYKPGGQTCTACH